MRKLILCLIRSDQQAIKSSNVYAVTAFNCCVIGAANLYLCCFAGAVLTDNTKMFADVLFDTRWWELPNQFQKYYIIMIALTQKPNYLEGYGIIRLTLEAFSKVTQHSLNFTR